MSKLSVKEKTGYGIGEIASNIIWQTVMFFLPIFYTDTFGLPAAVVGTMFLIVRIFDGINDPIMGTIADRTNSRWGKYRPYIFWMAIPYGIAGIFMFMTPNLSITGKIIYAYTTYILMMIVYTGMMIPFSALSGVMTSDYLERTNLNSYRFIGAFVGGLFIQGLALYMVGNLGTDNESLIVAHINKNKIEFTENNPGTAKVTLTATDQHGASISNNFMIKVFRQGENPPQVSQKIADTIVEEGFGMLAINLDGVFSDKDKDPLVYSVESSIENVSTAKIKNGQLVLNETGIGTSGISLNANDGNGGVASQTFLLRIKQKGNAAPVIRNTISDKLVSIKAKEQRFSIKETFGIFPEDRMGIQDIFTDPDRDDMFITAASNNPKVAAVTVIGTHLIIKQKSPGDANIMLTADDNKGGVATTSFLYSIRTIGNIPPVIDNEISDQLLTAGFSQHSVDFSMTFKDIDGDDLTYTYTINNDAKGYKYTMAIFALMCIVLFWITFFTTKERVKPVAAKNSKLTDDLKDLMKNGPWIILFIVSLLTLIYVAIRSAVIAYYFRYYVGDPGLTSAFLVIGSVTIILVLPLTKWLTKIFDKRLLYVICMILVGSSLLFYQFLGPEDIVWMFVLQILQSVGSAPSMPLLWSMLADSADYSEWKTGRKAMGLAYSASTLAQKVGFGLGSAIALWLLAWFGYQANMEQSQTSLMGMKLMMGLYPAIGAFVCALVIWFYKLDSKKMLLIEQDLKARRNEKE